MLTEPDASFLAWTAAGACFVSALIGYAAGMFWYSRANGRLHHELSAVKSAHAVLSASAKMVAGQNAAFRSLLGVSVLATDEEVRARIKHLRAHGKTRKPAERNTNLG